MSILTTTKEATLKKLTSLEAKGNKLTYQLSEIAFFATTDGCKDGKLKLDEIGDRLGKKKSTLSGYVNAYKYIFENGYNSEDYLGDGFVNFKIDNINLIRKNEEVFKPSKENFADLLTLAYNKLLDKMPEIEKKEPIIIKVYDVNGNYLGEVAQSSIKTK